MSSSVKPTAISDKDMATIRSALFLAGYDAGCPADGREGYSEAALLLMQKVRTGENSPASLAEHLNACFGRPAEEKVLFASVLPRYAMQGMPPVIGLKKRLGANSGLTSTLPSKL